MWLLTVLLANVLKSEGTKMEGNIVGGESARIQDVPYVVYLAGQCNETEKYRHHPYHWGCGSSVLNQRMLLTAAHCVYVCSSKSEIDAIAGSTDILNAVVLKRAQRYVTHAYYDEVELAYDIAMIMLNKNLPLGKTIQRVTIEPTFSSRAAGQVAGWGATNEEQDAAPSTLKYVYQRVWKETACHKYVILMHGTMCASNGDIYNYPCIGDSGSGLVTKDFQLLGLVSFRLPSKKDLIVYTNVSYFYKWIEKHSVSMYCKGKRRNK